jgi:hypothetical protein
VLPSQSAAPPLGSPPSLQRQGQIFPCSSQEYSQITHNYPGDVQVIPFNAFGNWGILTVTNLVNPIPQSSAHFTPNPMTTINPAGNLYVDIGAKAPPGDYDVTYTVKSTATARPTTQPDYNCIVVATPPSVRILNVNVGTAPDIEVTAGPTATNGEFESFLKEQPSYPHLDPRTSPIL